MARPMWTRTPSWNECKRCSRLCDSIDLDALGGDGSVMLSIIAFQTRSARQPGAC